jgi:hypothetical protein
MWKKGKKDLTEPALLEMDGFGVNQGLLSAGQKS